MNKRIIKPIIVFSIIIFIIIVFLIFSLSNKDSKSKKNNILNETEIITDDEIEDSDFNSLNNQKEDNNIESNRSSIKKIRSDIPDTDPWNEKGPIQEERLIFEKKTDRDAYFIAKQCLTLFYTSKDYALNTLENKLKQYDISNFYNNEKDFCIDEINMAHVTGSKDFYFIYYRVGVNQNNTENKQVLIKVDLKNDSFFVYPYEYLKSINYINLKDGDKISLDIFDVTDIEKTDQNNLNRFKIKKNESASIKEIYERIKFDINYDLNHLYNLIDEEYKNIRFTNNSDKFSSYIKSNKEKYLTNSIYGYQKYDLDWYTQFLVTFENDDIILINMVDIMNYSIQFDSYTTVIPIYSEIYNFSFPHIRAQYCIDRVKQAIDDKNYEFVYAKLNPVQKNNYYKNYNDFVSFIKTAFYEKNEFEYGKYTQISDIIYQYVVEVKDETKKNTYVKKLNISVTFKENDDFSISITQ